MQNPGLHNELDTWITALEEALDGIEAAAFGLTEAQARETACRSELSVGGIVTHISYVMNQLATRERDGIKGRTLDDAAFAAFTASFSLGERTLEQALTEFRSIRTDFIATARMMDPAARSLEPAAPWDGYHESVEVTNRCWFRHVVVEIARHAGHADIIREQIDGAQAGPLLMAHQDQPGNMFYQPWRAEAK